MKIAWAKQKGSGQIYSSGIEMALCSADGQQIGDFVFCKDFFQDAIKGFLNDMSSSIYGYSYNPKTQPPIDMKNTRVLMTDSSNPNLSDKVPAVLDFLNQVEKEMKLKPTKALVCDDPPSSYKKAGVTLYVGDPAWLQSSAALSMYTLLMRNGTVHTVGVNWRKTLDGIIAGKIYPAQENDATYLRYGKPGIDLIIEKGIVKVFGDDVKKNYAAKISTGTIHHHGGIVSFGSAKCAGTWPHWIHPPKPKSEPPSFCFS